MRVSIPSLISVDGTRLNLMLKKRKFLALPLKVLHFPRIVLYRAVRLQVLRVDNADDEIGCLLREATSAAAD
ncbi:MAG: hypothetical protein LBU65_07465 [Planctomycetaceae bacterium]|nr:hypothetical protein [Planctomycetaceae bacterium]